MRTRVSEQRASVDNGVTSEALDNLHGRAAIDDEAAGEWSGRWDEY